MNENDETTNANEIRDTLPADLDASAFVGPYKVPDNSRRRIPGYMYSAIGLAMIAIWIAKRDSDAVLVNRGLLVGGIMVASFGMFSISSGWRMKVDEKIALRNATKEVGFAVGHASAQQVWRGLRSRPTWRVLCYSSEQPPLQRALVLVDAVDGSIVERLVESNPDKDAPEWAEVAD
jgi:hypothetical protein